MGMGRMIQYTGLSKNTSSSVQGQGTHMNLSCSSEESGFQDFENSFDSSFDCIDPSMLSSTTNLSPVREASEPSTPTTPGFDFGQDTSKDTVIKVKIKEEVEEATSSKISRELFSTV